MHLPWPNRNIERPVDIVQLSESATFRHGINELAQQLDRSPDEVALEATEALRYMAAFLDPAAYASWLRLGNWLLRAYDIVADETALERLRRLDRRSSLVWLPSHRSYLDWWVLPKLLAARGMSTPYALGGENLDFFPLGPLARRTGTVFIRRFANDAPIYRLALRNYIGELTRNGASLGWSIEGGRTRTGKLRPPRHGLLRYLIDATETVPGPEIYLVPVSIVYDQLHEVTNLTAEALGSGKKPEDLRWLMRLARQQGRRLGHVYLDFGEPIPLRQRLDELAQDPKAAGQQVERLALEVSHQINQATPVTLTAVVTLALLAADRAVTFEEILGLIEPTAHYLQKRRWPVAGGQTLTDRNGIRRTLGELVNSGTVTLYDGGIESVWTVTSGQHLVAAFYRNTAIHVLINRAIAELALLDAATAAGRGDATSYAYRSALELRELLKFEFIFSSRAGFREEMLADLALIDPMWETTMASSEASADYVRGWLIRSSPHVAHIILRPFLDAYGLVAEVLLTHGPDETVDEERMLKECLGVGQQWLLQKRLADDESLSLELFRTAIKLARHRRLLDGEEPDVASRRVAFADEIRTRIQQLETLAAAARVKTEEQA